VAWSDAARAAALEVRRSHQQAQYRRPDRSHPMDRSRAFPMNEGYGRTEVSAGISQKLRAGSPLDDQQARIVRQLDRVIKKNRLARNTLLYHSGGIGDFKKVKTPTFISATRTQRLARAFGGKLVALQVPKGSHFALGDWHEQERILPRGGVFRRVGMLKSGIPIMRYGRR
jgi:hypothetical protein